MGFLVSLPLILSISIMKRLLYLLSALGFLVSFHTHVLAQLPPSIFEEGHISEIKLTIRQSNWSEVLDSMKMYGEGMIVGAAEIDGVKYPNIGIRYRGQTSYAYKGSKNPFQIKLDYIHPDQNHQGLTGLTLSNALRDPTYLREYLGFAIAREYMIAPRANFCKLYVNDQYAGLYINIEPIDKQFLTSLWGDQWTSLFKCSPETEKDKSPANCKKGTFANLEFEDDPGCYPYNYTVKEGEGWPDLIELTRILTQEPSRAHEYLDIDATLWMLAYNNVLVNLSSYSGRYSHNYYLVRNTSGRFTPIVWDLNLAFGSYKNTGKGSDLSQKELEKLNPFLHEDNLTKPLIHALLSNDLYNKMYVSHIKQIIKDNFKEDAFIIRTRSLQNVISNAVSLEKKAYYSFEEFSRSLDKTIGTKSKIPGLATFMQARVSFLRKHERFRAVTPEIVGVELTKRDKFAKSDIDAFAFQVVADKQPKRVHLFYRLNGDHEFKTTLLDSKQTKGLGVGQESYAITIPPGERTAAEIEYYLMVEGTAGVSFFPQDYRKKKLSVSLKDLN